MHLRRLLLPYLALSTLVFGCTPDSKNIGDTLETDSDSTATAGDETEGQSSTGDVTPSTSAATLTGDDPSASDPSVSGTSGVSTTGDDPGDSDPSVSGTSGPDPETTGANTGFDRFTLRTAAGPCPPRADCDGFVELTGAGILRVEKFGEVGNPVLEVEIEGADFAQALQVFADPALVEVLDSPDPLCDPPTDIFEQMEVELDGTIHEAATTTCSQAPLQAARKAAEELRLKYAP
ncbi:hypothetical protein OV203_45070 [Nannocystis sp. ILAH1]|uniref:hypothetical protein n=1 Tax=unclassified Nannocystis TaxID=2627009 RepID=UPI00226D7D30|nr:MULTISPECIES: hypothetical protein [unclassified Nannocystis]MCY0994382.1 hypothetical protein [Nannocystis sp. ILAH1]MCY1063466.1 hypothetical protein [Nannocystis sp. RBIL2]